MALSQNRHDPFRSNSCRSTKSTNSFRFPLLYLNEYRTILGNGNFEDILDQLKDELKDLQKRSKTEVEHAGRGDKKRIQAEYDEMIAGKNEEVTSFHQLIRFCLQR